MKLSDWAQQQGISPRTAWRLYKAGKLPVETFQTATGRIMVGKKPWSRLRDAAIFVLKTNDNDEDQIQASRMRMWAEQRKHTTTDNLCHIDTISKLPRLIRKHFKVLILQPGVLEPLTLNLLNAALKASGREVKIFDGKVDDSMIRFVAEHSKITLSGGRPVKERKNRKSPQSGPGVVPADE